MDSFFRYDPIIAGSKGLIYIGDKLLVYRRDTNTRLAPQLLDLPGGGPLADETPFETFAREVFEEFGLSLNPSDISEAHRYSSVLQPGKNAYFAIAYLPANAAEKIRFGDEGAEYMLMSPDEFLARDDAWKLIQEIAARFIPGNS